MEVIIRDTRDQAVSLAAALIARALVKKPNLVLGLALQRSALHAEAQQCYQRSVSLADGVPSLA